MSRSRAAAGSFAAFAVIAASLLGTAPAQAAPLPSGATINVIPDDGGIYAVNSTNAVGSLVGTASGSPNFAAIDVNQSGQGYAIAQDNEGEGSSFLYSANAVTGTLTELVEITNGGDSMRGCQGIDLSNAGVLTVSCIVDTGESLISLIGTVDPATGAFTGRTDFTTAADDLVRALASNSAGTLYYFTEFGEIFILEASDESTPVATADGRILGADFDITDQLWVTIGADGFEVPSEVKNTLETLNVTTGRSLSSHRTRRRPTHSSTP